MRVSFNLLDEPWMPCLVLRNDGSAERLELGIREVLRRAPRVRELLDPSPLVTLALHRLLLVILHRNFGPSSVKAWGTMWQRGEWDAEVLENYYQRWHSRFDLFDEKQPFYQAGSLDFQYAVAASKLTHELASGNNATLFDHTTERAAKSLSPAEAARYLVAHLVFAVGGLVSLEHVQDPKRYKSADAAPLVKGAVTLVKGENLFRTLMVNLHQYSVVDEEPFVARQDDCPAWERDKEAQAEDRWPSGYLDLLTWQSRRIRLQAETDSEGHIEVRGVVIMKGNQFPDGCWRYGRETMLAFRKNAKAKAGEEPWPAVAFQEDRGLWRDSLALFQAVEEQQARPMVLDWLNDLAADGVLSRSLTVPMDLYGVSTDKAKVLFWRHERLPLPLVFLEDKELLDILRAALDVAEQTGGVLNQSVWRLAKLLLAAESDRRDARQPDKKDVNNLAATLAPGRRFWPGLETPFKLLLVHLAKERELSPEDGADFGVDPLKEWGKTLRRAASRAFEETARGLDSSGRTLKAVAEAEHDFHFRLGALLSDSDNTSREVTHDPTRRSG